MLAISSHGSTQDWRDQNLPFDQLRETSQRSCFPTQFRDTYPICSFELDSTNPENARDCVVDPDPKKSGDIVEVWVVVTGSYAYRKLNGGSKKIEGYRDGLYQWGHELDEAATRRAREESGKADTLVFKRPKSGVIREASSAAIIRNVSFCIDEYCPKSLVEKHCPPIDAEDFSHGGTYVFSHKVEKDEVEGYEKDVRVLRLEIKDSTEDLFANAYSDNSGTLTVLVYAKTIKPTKE